MPPTENRIEWWEEPERNARLYRHVGCDEGDTPWIVPLDDSVSPTKAMQECDRCSEILPLKPRSQFWGTNDLLEVELAQTLQQIANLEATHREDWKVAANWQAVAEERQAQIADLEAMLDASGRAEFEQRCRAVRAENALEELRDAD